MRINIPGIPVQPSRQCGHDVSFQALSEGSKYMKHLAFLSRLLNCELPSENHNYLHETENHTVAH